MPTPRTDKTFRPTKLRQGLQARRLGSAARFASQRVHRIILAHDPQSLRRGGTVVNEIAPLHKWVCAPKGAAFLWAREDKQACLQPAVISHGNNRPRPGFTPFQDRFDWAGTADPTPWFCVGEAIRWMGRLLPRGWRELREHNHALAAKGRRILCERLQVEPPCPESLLGAMATIPLPERLQGRPVSGKIDVEQLQLCDRFGIEVPFLRFGQPERRWLRISAQLYNSPAEYDYSSEALQRV